MFEKEIKFVCDVCLNKISKAGSVLTFEKLKGIAIHPAILKYISAEIDFQIYKDRQALLQKSMFNYAGSEIAKYFKMIAIEIKKSHRVNEDELNQLINNAVTFNFNFTTKPNETLLNFVFNDADTRSPEELKMFLEFPFYYGYIKQILLSYINKKQIMTLDKGEFKSLLSKIDLELFPSRTIELVDNALEAISDFFNIGAVIRYQIPPASIQMYLQEKELTGHLSLFEEAAGQTPKAKYEISEIRKIIFTDEPTEEQAKNQTEEKEIDTKQNDSTTEQKDLGKQNKKEKNNKKLSEKISTSEKKDLSLKDKPIKAVQNIEIDEFEITAIESKDTIDMTNDDNIIEEDSGKSPLESNEIKKSAQRKAIENLGKAAKVPKDVLSFLTKKEAEKIIGSIFNEDKQDFAATIEAISECKTYEEATAILQSVYTTYNVNPYSHDAIVFTNAIAKYYSIT